MNGQPCEAERFAFSIRKHLMKVRINAWSATLAHPLGFRNSSDFLETTTNIPETPIDLQDQVADT